MSHTLHSTPLGTEEAGALQSCGTALRLYRERLWGYSQEELAKLLLVPQSWVRRMEEGDPNIPLGVWMRAWRRVYNDPIKGETLLQAVQKLAGDPADIIARAGMVAAAQAAGEPVNPRISADAAYDMESEQKEVLNWMSRIAHRPPQTAEDPTDPEDPTSGGISP
ncbi:MAG: helix-turn-helix transcriptional regulator [Gammaproteobacteria bacterium]|nr:helix-turn-helix transcriptional regulator [Gammaproteobacteria bacterium]